MLLWRQRLYECKTELTSQEPLIANSFERKKYVSFYSSFDKLFLNSSSQGKKKDREGLLWGRPFYC